MRLFELFNNTSLDIEKLIYEADGKNTHLDHAEEIIFMQGSAGIARVTSTFEKLLDQLEGGDAGGDAVTTKWDGSPAVFCGIDPNDGKFFVGTKGVFAKNAKLNKTTGDIEKNHPDVVKQGETVNKEGLRDKLNASLKHLSGLGIQGVIQGDLLFTREDVKTISIEGKKHVAFKPNTITYVVPADSELGQRISAAEIGIVFHTSYEGDSVENMSARFGYDSSQLTPSKDVWFTDARIRDVSGQVQLSDTEGDAIRQAIADLKTTPVDSAAFNKLDDLLPFDLIQEIKAHANTPIRSGKALESNPKRFASSFIERIEDQYEAAIAKLKTGREGPAGQKRLEKLAYSKKLLTDNSEVIANMYIAYLKAEATKMMFQRKMRNIKALDSFIEQPDGSLKVTDPEGFVIVDHMGNAIKIVDRLEFSAANFLR